MKRNVVLLARCWIVTATLLMCGGLCAQDDAVSPVDDEGRVVSFQRDIVPIFVDRCLECHGPEDAKNDFRVDDVDSVMGYVEAEDAELSTMYADYLITDSEDELMPPASHGGPLSAGELALIRVWINEGADWPDDAVVAAPDAEAQPAPAPQPTAQNRTLMDRVWAFQGYFHPATVHFPIALLLFGAFFVVLGWKWPSVGTQIPLACLLLGAPTAIVATLMGWSFATEQGYGGWTTIDFDSEVFWHRWSGVIVAALAALFALIALVSLRKDETKLTGVWKGGLLVLALLVGLVGHQGGELSYGHDFYPKAFRILLGTPDEDPGEAKEVVAAAASAVTREAESKSDSGAESAATSSPPAAKLDDLSKK